MISVEEARARILARLRPVGTETVSVADAWNRVTAAPIVARRTQPPRDVSAMDGYALRAADAAAGAVLRVIGEAPAGHPFIGHVASGQAVRLFTGSVVPDGADAILIQENADRAGTDLTVRTAPVAGQHIRKQGHDFALGDAVLPAGRRLSPRDIGLAAAADHPWLSVHRRPRIAILATGDEIVLPGEPVPDGGIVSSNSLSLAALVRAAGGEPVLLPTAPDRVEAIADATKRLQDMDLLVTSGGASVGDHDLVQQGLTQNGFALDFWKIAMRPGKPLIHGRMGDLPMLGLPGNPVSALVCATLFLLPALRRLAGMEDITTPSLQAKLGIAVKANDHRADYLRGHLRAEADGLVATPFPRQDSFLLRMLSEADCLILRPPHAPAAESGTMVEVIPLTHGSH